MINLYVILGLLVTALGGIVYIQHLRASNASLSTQVTALDVERKTLAKKIDTDSKVRAADEARATADIKALQSFKDKAHAQIKGLQNPDRLCLDRDDTKRLQHIFER